MRNSLKRYVDFTSSVSLVTSNGESSYYQEEINNTNNTTGKVVIKGEKYSLGKNKTWELVELRRYRNVV